MPNGWESTYFVVNAQGQSTLLVRHFSGVAEAVYGQTT